MALVLRVVLLDRDRGLAGLGCRLHFSGHVGGLERVGLNGDLLPQALLGSTDLPPAGPLDSAL